VSSCHHLDEGIGVHSLDFGIELFDLLNFLDLGHEVLFDTLALFLNILLDILVRPQDLTGSNLSSDESACGSWLSERTNKLYQKVPR
jgi:hypothetical protein